MSLPNGWINCRFGDVASIRNGYAFKSVDFKTTQEPDYDVPLIRQSQLKSSIVDISDVVYLPKTYLKKHSDYVLKKGDILIGMSGSIGRVCLYDNEIESLQNQRTGKITPHSKNEISSQFFGLFLSNIERTLIEFSKGVGVQNISSKDIEDLSFNLPPLNEQHRIVAKIEELFSELDQGIDNLKTAQAQLKIYRQALLKHAFEGKLTTEWRAQNADKLESASALQQRIQHAREQRYQQQLAEWQGNEKQSSKPKAPKPITPLTAEELEQLPELPEGWGYFYAEDLCDFITKGTTPSKEKLFDNTGDVPFIKVYNLTKTGKLDFTIEPTFVSNETHNGFLNRSKVYPGDVLMNIVGPPLGKVSIVPDTHPEWNINQAIAIFRSEHISPKLLSTYLSDERIVNSMMSKSKATAGQFNLTLEICRETIIPIFAEQEQTFLEALLDERISQIDQLDQTLTTSLQQAEALRQSILKKAFSGELVPQDPNDEPASALLARIKEEKQYSQTVKSARNK